MSDLIRIHVGGISWKRVSFYSPPEKTLLMVTGSSGMSTNKRFLTTAFIDRQYRPDIDGKTRWLDITLTDLSDYGWEPEFWALPMELPS